MLDISHHINETRRSVGQRVLEAGEARTVTIARSYEAPIEEVWDACTNAERIPRWFLPVTGTLEPGGSYRLQGNASGTVERCEPPRSFFATWEFGGNVSWIELRLAPLENGGTRLELEHIASIDDSGHWDQFGPAAVGVGWDMALLGLRRHLESGDAVDPQRAREWAASDAGRRFAALSSESWCAADIAAGTEPGDARAKATRTLDFYTGAAPSGSGALVP